MRALRIVRRELDAQLDFLHSGTRAALWRGVSGLLKADQLWLTALGRGMPGDTVDKHRIKAADRLLGNKTLHGESIAICSALAHYLIRGIRQPCILVDWTGVGHHHHAITASLVFFGRSLPILSSVYPNDRKGSSGAETEFLQQLAEVIPSACTPIIITDAGFHEKWFKQVVDLGWDFIGRLRGTMHVCVDDDWLSLPELHRMAGKRSRDFGIVPMGRLRTKHHRLVLSSKRKSKGRKLLTLKGTDRLNTDSKRARSAAREPWVLATSLKCGAKKVVARYAFRTQTEECFRDHKAYRHGWSLNFVGSRTPQRIAVLMLLAALAVVVMHTIGIAAEHLKMHRGYQANTMRKRRVFSTFFLARLLVRDRRVSELDSTQLRRALASLRLTLRSVSAAA